MARPYRELYRKKIANRGSTPMERNFNLKQREFDLYFANTLNRYTVPVNDERYADVVFQDHSQSNNKDLSDDKYIVYENDTQIDVGDYIYWSDTHWIVFSREHKTIQSHQQAKVKEANQRIKWIKDGKVVNDGIGWYAYVQSQTLYTLGVKTTKEMSLVDSKMTMYMQANEDTLSLEMGDRIFIGSRVYKINFIDTVSRKGLIHYLLAEDTVDTKYDNVEAGVADFYRVYNEDDDVVVHDGVVVENREALSITGPTSLRISRTYSFESNIPVSEWSVIQVDDDILPYELVYQDENKLTITIKDNRRFVGRQLTVMAESEDGQIDSHPVTLAVKY